MNSLRSFGRLLKTRTSETEPVEPTPPTPSEPVTQPLTELPSEALIRSQSNKLCEQHNYGGFYDLIFCALRCIVGEPLKVLELGCTFNGIGSGHTFSKMPVVEKYVGVDIFPPKMPFSEKGTFIHADLYTKETVEILKAHAPFHLIIDDAVHELEKNRYVFENYRGLLATPGIMVIEDIPDLYVDAYKKAFIDTDDPNIHLIRCPAKEKVKKEYYKGISEDTYICNLLMYLNLSEKEPIGYNFENYYQCLIKEGEYLESLSDRTDTETQRLQAISNIINSLNTPEVSITKDVQLANAYYDEVMKQREALRDNYKEDKRFIAFNDVSYGIASPEQHAIVSKHFEPTETS